MNPNNGQFDDYIIPETPKYISVVIGRMFENK